MTHFVALVNIGVPPKGLTKKEEENWIKERFEFIVNPFSENKEVDPYIYESRKTIDKEIDELMKDRNDPNSYVGKEYPNRDFKSEPIDEFIEKWYGMKADKRGNSLSTYNPSGRWDWYEIGGRWKGRLITKKKQRVDMCKVKELDLEAYHSEAAKNASVYYALFVEYIVRTNNGEQSDELKKLSFEFAFSNTPRIKQNDNGELEIVESYEDFYKRGYNAGYFSFKTFVDVYGWHSETSYGWFGMSHGDEHVDEYLYAKRFEEKIKSLHDESVLAVVDFHV